jgi:death-on-curing protein
LSRADPREAEHRREPRWLSSSLVLAIHTDQIREHGGSLGLRDEGRLESALARPINLLGYEPGSDLESLAAAYGFGIASNHPFVDGNKRVAFQAMYVFLGLNGLRVVSDEREVVELMFAVASGDTAEERLAAWLRDHTESR